MGKIDSGFTNADSDNLPKVDMAMVNDFYVDNMQFFNTKMRNVKAKKFMKKKVKQAAKEKRLKDDYNVCAILRMNYPKQCDWLRFFACARRKCLICEEPEPRNRSDFVQCENEYCMLLYCQECWTDMGKECLRCQVESEVSSAYETEEEYSD